MKVEIVRAQTWFSGDRNAAKARTDDDFHGYERRNPEETAAKPASQLASPIGTPQFVSPIGTTQNTCDLEPHLVSTFAAQALGQILTPKRPDHGTASRAYRRASEKMFDVRAARAGEKLV